jgi:polysaccharide biosynthesis protein PslG
MPTKGVCFHGLWGSIYPNNAKRIQVLDKLAANGCTAIRFDVGWDGIEPTKGAGSNWYLDIVDFVVTEAANRGIKTLIMLWLTPGWANNNLGAHYFPTNPNDYAVVARHLALRYKEKLAGIEVWNEPDAYQTFLLVREGHNRYKDIVEITRATKQALVGTGVPVVLGAPSSCDDQFYKLLYTYGLKPGDYDIASVHAYQGDASAPPEYPDDGNRWWFTHLPAVRKVMSLHGESRKPIWITEYGWSTNTNTPSTQVWEKGVDEDTQADYLKRSYAYARQHYPRVTAMFWYNEIDTGSNSTLNQDRFGLLRQDLSEKPALKTLKIA